MQVAFHETATIARRATKRGEITFWALVSVVLGTFLAVLDVPEELSESSQVVPSLLMTGGLLAPVVIQIRRNLLEALRVENFVMLGLVYWLMLDLLQSAYPLELVSKTDVQWAYAMIGVFAAFVWLGAAGRAWKLPKIVAKSALMRLSNRTLYLCLCIGFGLGMAKFVIGARFDPFLLISGLGMPRWSAPWARGQFGGTEAIFDHLQYFGYSVPSITILLAMRMGWLRARVLIALGLSVIMLLFLAQGGGRRVIGVAVGAALVTWIAAHPVLRPKTVLFAGGAVTMLLFVLQEMLRYRRVGFAAWWRGERPELNVEHLHVDDNFLRLSQLISFYPSEIDFIHHKVLYHAITLPVPRFLWSGKPSGAGFDLAELVGREGVALTSSILGELWVSAGFVAIILGGFIVGRLSGMWNKILFLPKGDAKPVMFGLGLMVVFAGLRSMQAMVQMSYILLAIMFVLSIASKVARGRKSSYRKCAR